MCVIVPRANAKEMPSTVPQRGNTEESWLKEKERRKETGVFYQTPVGRYCAEMAIRRGLACSAFGSSSSSTPFCIRARMRSASMVLASVKRRE